MAKFWIIERGSVIVLGVTATEEKEDQRTRLEIHKAIISALKDVKQN